MKRVLLDTNVVLDVLLDRHPWSPKATLQIACATAAKLTSIVTRDPAGFTNCLIEVLTPDELLQQLALAPGD
jgi:predicted nucleic acid-binding protein